MCARSCVRRCLLCRGCAKGRGKCLKGCFVLVMGRMATNTPSICTFRLSTTVARRSPRWEIRHFIGAGKRRCPAPLFPFLFPSLEPAREHPLTRSRTFGGVLQPQSCYNRTSSATDALVIGTRDSRNLKQEHGLRWCCTVTRVRCRLPSERHVTAIPPAPRNKRRSIKPKPR